MSDKNVNLKFTELRHDPQDIVPASTLKSALEVSESEFRTQKLHEIQQLLWLPEGASVGERNTRLVRALELYESLEPADGAEGMLALQMVGTHDAALMCLKRAAMTNQTFAVVEMSLKHAHKLMSLYTQQLAALNKHRGKGQQKVTVEHVNVEPGGQAIVGNVETNRKQSPSEDLKAIEQRTYTEGEEILDIVRSAKAKIDARRK